jgi:hypothetical protein
VGAENIFLDVPDTHPAHAAVAFLHTRGLIQGYDDGTFRVDQQVDRAAALKIALAGRVVQEDVEGRLNPGFSDIPAGAWYEGYVARAVELGIIDGPQQTTVFGGNRSITRAEFLKLLLRGQQMDPQVYGDVLLPLAPDTSDSSAWFYPYARSALAMGVIDADADGMLHPEATMTRGDVAQALHAVLLFAANQSVQTLLSTAEGELADSLLPHLNASELPLATMAYARALVMVRGALTLYPDNPIVLGAMKITEGFGSLVHAYDAGISGRTDDVITFSGTAYTLSEEAKALIPSMDILVASMQSIAHAMAEEARVVRASMGE